MNCEYQCKICDYNKYTTLVEGIKDWEYGFEGNYAYNECQNCKSIQIHPFPSIDDLIEAYKIDYHGFTSPSQKGSVYTMLYELVDMLATREIKKYLHADSKVLDIGCGIGLFLSKLKSMGLHGIEGIDFSETAVKAVRAQGIQCYHGTFAEFDKKQGFYDALVMKNYLEHTLNPLEELIKARFILKDDGVLFGELPNFDSCDRWLFGRYWGGNHVPRHTFQFNAENLRSLFRKAGFSRIEMQYPLNTSHFALSIQNYFQRNRTDLKNNNALEHGRAKYYSLFMVSLVPVNIFCKFMRKTGFMEFYARP